MATARKLSRPTRKIFGGKNRSHADPRGGRQPLTRCLPEWQKKILHGRIDIGNAVLMASDAPPGSLLQAPRVFSVNIGLTDIKEAERIFSALSEKRQRHHAPRRNLLGRIASVCSQTRFGIPWMVNVERRRRSSRLIKFGLFWGRIVFPGFLEQIA